MFKIGHGYDIHRLVFGRKLILCGEEIAFKKGLLGHSDADVCVHAIIDSLLGAAGLFDIGHYFKDFDPSNKGVSSLIFLEKVDNLLKKKGFEIVNIDSTIVLQAPKIFSYIDKMKKNLADTLYMPKDYINIKAKTNEGLGSVGEGLAVASFAVCLLKQKKD